MKKTIVFLAVLALLGSGFSQAQSYLKFKSFDFEKGLVMADDTYYTACTFTIKEKSRADVEVSSVLVDGREVRFLAIQKTRKKTLYVVKIPRKMQIPAGSFFDLTINLSFDGGRAIGGVSGMADEGDPGDGGPGNSTDPTIIVIKYP